MKVIIENEVVNGTFTVRFVRGEELLETTITAGSVQRAVRLAYDACSNADGFSMWCDGIEVASGFGIPGMNHLEVLS